jgi:hypothetical protein
MEFPHRTATGYNTDPVCSETKHLSRISYVSVGVYCIHYLTNFV